MKNVSKLKMFGIAALSAIAMLSVQTQAALLVGWDVDGVNAGAFSGPTHTFDATTTLGSVAGQLSLGSGVTASSTANTYGYDSPAGSSTSLANAIANNNYIQFTLTGSGTFNLTSLEMDGETTSTGSDDVAWLSSIDGFTTPIQSLTGRQALGTGDLDTDASGWGAPIDLTAAQYQGISSITFRLYGFNSGAGVTRLRNLGGENLILNGTFTAAAPEPSSLALLGLGGVLLARKKKRLTARS